MSNTLEVVTIIKDMRGIKKAIKNCMSILAVCMIVLLVCMITIKCTGCVHDCTEGYVCLY